MKVFERESIQTHCVGQAWPEFLGQVRLGESFIVETEQFNRANGPIAIDGVSGGEPIVVHIERIQMHPPFRAPNGGPFFEGIGDPIPLELDSGHFRFPEHFQLRSSPSVGNIAILPQPTEAILDLARHDPLERGYWLCRTPGAFPSAQPGPGTGSRNPAVVAGGFVRPLA